MSCRLSQPIINSRVFRTLLNISIVLPCSSPQYSQAPCARLLHALCPVTTSTTSTTTTTTSPHIHAQPRASSRSRPASVACPTRRALAHSRRCRCRCCCYCKPRRHTLQVQRCVHLLCLVLPYHRSRHWARIPRVCCWRFRSSLARLASTGPTVSSSRTQDAISLQPPLGLQLPDHLQQRQHRLALRSPSSSALPPHELSSCSRARNSV